MQSAQDFLNDELGQFDSGGGGSNRYIGRAPKPLTQKLAGAVASPYVDPGETEASQKAMDNGKDMPIAASKYLAYKDDPEWQRLDKSEDSTMSTVGSLFTPILDRLTRGAYSSSKMNSFAMAGKKKREIEKRYLDEATIAEANREKFDYAKPNDVDYDESDGKHYNVYIGSHGSQRRIVTDSPTKLVTDESGIQRNVVMKPGMAAMYAGARGETTNKYIDGQAEPPTEGPFAGGVADAETPMRIIRDPKALNDIAESGAKVGTEKSHTAYYDAQTEKIKQSRQVYPAGSSVSNASGTGIAFTVPDHARAAGGADGFDRNNPTGSAVLNNAIELKAKMIQARSIGDPEYANLSDDEIEQRVMATIQRFGGRSGEQAPQAGGGGIDFTKYAVPGSGQPQSRLPNPNLPGGGLPAAGAAGTPQLPVRRYNPTTRRLE